MSNTALINIYRVSCHFNRTFGIFSSGVALYIYEYYYVKDSVKAMQKNGWNSNVHHCSLGILFLWNTKAKMQARNINTHTFEGSAANVSVTTAPRYLQSITWMHLFSKHPKHHLLFVNPKAQKKPQQTQFMQQLYTGMCKSPSLIRHVSRTLLHIWNTLTK